MAEEITADVWRYAPDDVTGTRLLVLLRLANSATSEHRITTISIVKLLLETRAKKTAVYDALNWLYAKGIIQDVADVAVPQWGQTYRSVTRRIVERELWNEGCPAPIFVPPESGMLQSVFRIPESDKPESDGHSTDEFPESGPIKSSSLTEKRKSKPKSSSTKTPQPSAEPVEPKIESKAERSRRMIREEDDLDPAKALFPEDQIQVAQRTPGEPGPDTGNGLALYFSRQYSMATSNAFIHWHNRSKLAGAFNTWMRDGVTPDQIRAMVDIYVSRPDLHDPKKIAWVDLLAKRAVLGAEIDAERLLFLHRPENFNVADWTSQRGSQDLEKSDADYEFDYEKWKRGQ